VSGFDEFHKVPPFYGLMWNFRDILEEGDQLIFIDWRSGEANA
jgi:hypothetical protein